MNSNQRSIMQQAVAEANAGRIQKAVGLLAAYIESDPANISMLRLAALLYHKAGNLQQAARLLQRVVHKSPQDTESRYNLGIHQFVGRHKRRSRVAGARVNESLLLHLPATAFRPYAGLQLSRKCLQIEFEAAELCLGRSGERDCRGRCAASQ